MATLNNIQEAEKEDKGTFPLLYLQFNSTSTCSTENRLRTMINASLYKSVVTMFFSVWLFLPVFYSLLFLSILLHISFYQSIFTLITFLHKQVLKLSKCLSYLTWFFHVLLPYKTLNSFFLSWIGIPFVVNNSLLPINILIPFFLRTYIIPSYQT